MNAVPVEVTRVPAGGVGCAIRSAGAQADGALCYAKLVSPEKYGKGSHFSDGRLNHFFGESHVRGRMSEPLRSRKP
jgi:hypothetical protein